MDRWGVHGRGMALFSIRENAKVAGVDIGAPGKGASIKRRDRRHELPERADQSTWPTLGEDEDGRRSCGRGPHNIIRTCCEFALEERGNCEVYVGSPAEIAATARARVTPEVAVRPAVRRRPLGAARARALQARSRCSELREVAAGLGLRCPSAPRIASYRARSSPCAASPARLERPMPRLSPHGRPRRDRRGSSFPSPMRRSSPHDGARFLVTWPSATTSRS